MVGARIAPRGLLLAAASLLLIAGIAPAVFGDTQEIPQFVRGDVSGDGKVRIIDTLLTLDYLFGGATAAVECDRAYDIDDSGALNIADAVYGLRYLFMGGPAAPAPATCGLDATADTLTCNEYPTCDPVIIELPLSPAELALRADIGHVLRRVAYGQTPELFDSLLELDGGVEAFIEAQLDPASIEENESLTDTLEALGPHEDVLDLYRTHILRALYSERQLLEILTDFWSVHFNTYLWTVQAYFNNLGTTSPGNVYTSDESDALAAHFESLEDEAFRAGALDTGSEDTFHNLLLTSATSVAMLIYLDSVANIAGDPNENYAREILELHSVGVDNGYDQTDIENLARIFTGWTICLVDEADAGDPLAECHDLVLDPAGAGLVWAFHFDPDRHDWDAKTVFHNLPLSQRYVVDAADPDPQAGLDEGLLFIEYLANSSLTAEYVSTKLVQRFVSDEAPPALVADCVVTWLSTGGDLSEVVRTILTSEEFLGEEYRLNKVRTPLEYIAATVRAFGGEVASTAGLVLDYLTDFGQIPYNFKTPDGYPEFGDEQGGTARMLMRMRFVGLLYEPSAAIDFSDKVTIMRDRDVGLNSTDEVAGFWLDRLFANSYTDIDKELALEFLGTNDIGNPQQLQSWANLYPNRIGKFLAFLASLPQHLKQ